MTTRFDGARPSRKRTHDYHGREHSYAQPGVRDPEPSLAAWRGFAASEEPSCERRPGKSPRDREASIDRERPLGVVGEDHLGKEDADRESNDRAGDACQDDHTPKVRPRPSR